MFTVAQIELAHSRIKSGAEFPKYIQKIKALGVAALETWVADSRTIYFGKEGFTAESKPKYDALAIAPHCNKDKFIQYLKIHQRGETDYFTFCRHCAETGIQKWVVNLEQMTCVYYDGGDHEVLMEFLPTV